VEPVSPRDVKPPVKQLNWTTIALIGGLLLLVLMFAYFASNRDPDQDKLSDSQISQSGVPAATADKACASRATYDLIKRELFRRAAQLRGSDGAAYDQLSAHAVLRMENPVMESENEATRAVQCSGSVAIDLPPGVVAVGGRRSLVAGIDYSVQPAADGTGNVVLLRNADAIITPLATLARANQPAGPPVATPGLDSLGQPMGNVPPATQGPAEPPAAAPTPARANPSFNCANARTRGEIAVCGDAGLAALDRQMAAQFNRAIGQASDQQRFLLLRTRADFLEFRDKCRAPSCIADAYNGRMREISDIMGDRWRSR
jgi:uncharacterized protein YecT (DUF1311 family)